VIRLKRNMLTAGLAVAVAASALLIMLLGSRSARPPGAAGPLSPPASARPGWPASGPPHGHCAAHPHRCGFPDATDAGVPARTALRAVPRQVSRGPGWYYDARQHVVQVTRAGAVLTGLSFACTVNVKASRVTITRDRITTSGQSSFGVSLRHVRNVTVSDTTITGRNATRGRIMAGIKDIYGDSTGTRILRDNIAWTSTGVQIEAGLIEGNYIHSPGYRHGDHINGVTSDGGRRLLRIIHNTILIDRAQTDAIGLFEDFGRQAHRVIYGNLLAGGSYAIYGGQNSGGPAASGIRITRNRISRIYFARGGYWGAVTAFNPAGRGNVWARNVWDGTGHSVARP
jgi:hypothetical protein